MSELPESWLEARLGQVLQFNYGKALPDRLRSGNDFPVYGSNGIVGYHNASLTAAETIIIGRKGSVGEVNYSASACSPIDTTYFVDQFGGMPSRFWFYLLKSLNLGELNKATAIPGLNREDAYRVSIPLPPLNEQKRIAAKLDALLQRVDVCRAHLERVPLLLKRFRQAVLAAATSGQLTEDWRNTQYAPHKEKRLSLISEINQKKSKREIERARRIKAEEWFFDVESALPETWLQVNLMDITHLITCGVAKRPEYVLSGVPFLSAQNAKPFKANLKDIRYISEKDFKTFTIGGKPEKNDILYSRVGAKFGEAAKILFDFDFAIYVSLTLIKPIHQLVNADFMVIFLNSHYGQLQAHGGIFGSGIQNLNVEVVRKFRMPLPPLAEQAEIVRRVETLFGYADRLEARYHEARAQVEQLTPALLAKAFRGELVPQDPNDEPASVLLARLQAERAATSPKPRGRFPAKSTGKGKPTVPGTPKTKRAAGDRP